LEKYCLQVCFYGSSGANFDIDLHYYAYYPEFDDYYEYTYATLDFDFDVSSFTFIFGGNSGSFSIYAMDEDGNTLDYYYQRSTAVGEFAGPWTLTGQGIRQIEWSDHGGWSYAPIDNITIVASTHIPEPSSLAFFLLGVDLYAGLMRYMEVPPPKNVRRKPLKHHNFALLRQCFKGDNQRQSNRYESLTTRPEGKNTFYF